MEALSGVASGMAVASLAIQLLQSIATIRTFIENVKGASKELARLIDLLANLSGLLDHVRTLVEKQISLQQCPLPCQAIFDCLRSCETSLASLERVVAKYEKKPAANTLSSSRLKHDIRFAFMAKDVTSFEDRIQRDVANLNTALGVNTADIQLTALSILLRLERTALATTLAEASSEQSSIRPEPRALCSQFKPFEFENRLVPISRSNVRVRTRRRCIESPLQMLGIHQLREIRYLEMSNRQGSTNSYEGTTVISTSYDAFWTLLGYGIRWSRRYPYGNILPSLRVYPIVKHFPFDDRMTSFKPWTSSVEEIQQCFSSGAMHPFSKDSYGYDLLHYAAVSLRPDICRLLAEYGLKPSVHANETTPLLSCLNMVGKFPWAHSERERKQAEIDTLRVLLFHFDQVDDVSNLGPLLKNISMCFPGKGDLDAVEWFWNHAAMVFHGTDLACLRAILLREIIRMSGADCNPQLDDVNETLIRLMDEDVLQMYRSGQFSLLPRPTRSELHNDRGGQGAAVIDLLLGLGLDIATCLHMEQRLFLEEYGPRSNLQMRYGQRPDQQWVLQWTWMYDADAPGYDVVSTFDALTTDAYWLTWPFQDEPWDFEGIVREGHRKMVRFERRMAIKERKQRAKNREKRPRSQMPGTWKW